MKTEWKRITIPFTWTEGGREVTEQFRCWRWRNVVLMPKGTARKTWAMLHEPTMLGFAARWEKLRDAKAGVERINADFDLAQVTGPDSLGDPESRRRLVEATRKHRQMG